MFKKPDEPIRRRRSGVGIVRMFLSLIIMIFLGVGLYLAIRNFSGYDPLKISPNSIQKTVFGSELVYKVVNGALSYSPKGSFQGLKDQFQKPKTENAKTDPTPSPNLKYKFAIVSDPHKDSANLLKALKMAKQADAKFVIGIGDFSDVGTIDELRNIKQQFDTVNLPYYTTPGDHDLWDSRDKNKPAQQNFVDVFGTTYQSFSYLDTRFVLVYDADTYQGLDGVQMKWLSDEMTRIQTTKPKTFFVITGTPIYHPSSDHVMGRVTPKLTDQAKSLIELYSKSGVNEVFAGDTHFFSQYIEPTHNLKMTTVGAVTADRNPQAPRFVMVAIFEDGSYNIQDTEIK